jgi:adenosylcobinamide-GDP ribazoletransferase
MKSALLALQFLTITPVKVNKMAGKDLSRSLVFFPMIGLLLGLVLAAAGHLLFTSGINSFAIAAILVVLLVIMTGGLHLDGLSDSADAFFSGKGKDEMLRIMRDPHVGSMGMIALISLMMLKAAFLSSINPATIGRALVVMCVSARWSMVLSLFVFPYARQEGKAKAFTDGVNKSIFTAATIVAVIIVFIAAKTAGIVILAMAALFTCAAGLFVKRKIGGVTGDTIGAVSELTEAAVLAAIMILERLG